MLRVVVVVQFRRVSLSCFLFPFRTVSSLPVRAKAYVSNPSRLRSESSSKRKWRIRHVNVEYVERERRRGQLRAARIEDERLELSQTNVMARRVCVQPAGRGGGKEQRHSNAVDDANGDEGKKGALVLLLFCAEKVERGREGYQNAS